MSPSETTTKVTFCRICEALCGLEVDLRGDEVVAVRPDRKHPVSKGFACVKGVGLGALHHDPDRLNYPQKRVNGKLERIPWDTAIREIGAKLRAIRDAHGPRALAMYTGNPTFFNFKSFFFSEQFVDVLGTPNLFASHSIDCNNKFEVAQRMYGLPTIHPIVDLENVKFLMILGGNPAASQMSFMVLPNAISRLKAIEKRGGRVVIVDPRRTETAEQVGEHYFIRPGTDAYLLMAMAQVVISEGHVVRSVVERFTKGFDTLASVVAPFTPERVSEVTGIDSTSIRELARAYARADGAALYMSTGVNMGPFGSISYWILQSLNLITGNVDRRGGLLEPKGPFDLLKLTSVLGVGKRGRTTRDGRFHGVVDALPVGALAEEIQREGSDRIRALVVSAGNPVHSVPGGRLKEALSELELLVCLDIYPSETTQFAHYVLPATDMLERSDYPITISLNQETPCAQYTEAVVKAKHERREEWEVFSDLALAMGRPIGIPTLCHAFGLINKVVSRVSSRRVTPDLILDVLFGAAGDVTMDELRKEPHGILLPRSVPGSLLGKRVYTKDHKVDLAPEACVRDVQRLIARELDFVAQRDQLVMIGRREKRSHNSWMHNHAGIQQPPSNAALLHPHDAQKLGASNGSTLRIQGNGQTISLPARVTDNVREGVVVLPHGWGHAESGLSRASKHTGANVNHVIPGGVSQLEPVSGQAIMVAQPVRVEVLQACAEAGQLLPDGAN